MSSVTCAFTDLCSLAARALSRAASSSVIRIFSSAMSPSYPHGVPTPAILSVMSRYRLYPTREQEIILLDACGHARYVWNLALGQRLMWRRWQGPVLTRLSL